MQRPDRQFLLRHPAHIIALGGGAGLSRKAPGTIGTLATFPLWWMAISLGGNSAVAVLACALFVLGIWAADVCGRNLGVSDHGSIVIDEIAGFMLVLAMTPHHWLWMLIAFGLFRLFDITKPWPIRVADAKIKGGFGVMFDDLLAALLAIGCLLFLQQLFPQ